MRRNKLRTVLCILLAVVLLSNISDLKVFAAEENDNLKTVRVGYTIYGGFQEGEGDEPKSGYGYEYLQQVAYYAGWKYEYVNGSFNELLEMLKNGEIDIMGNISYTEERAQFIDYAAEEQGREYYYLFVREDRTDISASDLSTMNGIKVGINKGSIQADMFADWCRENNLNVEIILYESSTERNADLESGLLDATVSTNMSATVNTKYYWNPIVKIGSSLYYFATNKNRPDILEDLNAALYQVLQSDWYYNERVYLKYYGNTSASVAGLTQSEISWAKQRNAITVGYMDDFLPYSDFDDDLGKPVGFLSSFLNMITERYGVKFDTKLFDSYTQMEEALKNGEIDTMFPAYGSYWIAEENNLMIADVPIGSQVLIIGEDNDRADMTSVIAVTDRNSMQQFYVKEYFPNSKVVVCDSMTDCVRASMDGRATCTLMSSDVYYAYYRDFQDFDAYRIVNSGYAISCGFGTTRDNIDTYCFMKKCVSSITETEMNEALIANHHVDDDLSVVEFLQKNVLLVLAVVGIILVLLITLFVYYVISSRNAMKLMNRNNELKEKAFTDFATGLPNKNKCEQMLSSPLAVRQPTACYMIDLNGLKIINDTLGHETGDAMILNFAKLLRQAVPVQHFVGRFGGDEFIVIAENLHDVAEAEQLMKKLADIVEEYNRTNDKYKISYACGCAFSKEYPSCNIMELLNIADQRMYEDKKNRRCSI